MKFATNNKACINLNIGYDDKTIEEVQTTNSLGFCGWSSACNFGFLG
jgi:hypothetical protein